MLKHFKENLFSFRLEGTQRLSKQLSVVQSSLFTCLNDIACGDIFLAHAEKVEERASIGNDVCTPNRHSSIADQVREALGQDNGLDRIGHPRHSKDTWRTGNRFEHWGLAYEGRTWRRRFQQFFPPFVALRSKKVFNYFFVLYFVGDPLCEQLIIEYGPASMCHAFIQT